MPIGIIINSLSVALGGILGAWCGNKLPHRLKTQLNVVFGLCSMGMGISSLILMKNMPAVIFAIVVGTGIGLVCNLGIWVNKGAAQLEKPIGKIFKNNKTELSREEYMSTLVTIIVLFCASGMGIYGSLDAGMTGDSTILISKSVLDLFTAAVFACNLGYVVSAVAVPQFAIFVVLVLCSKVILPLASPDMIADFKACGGFLMVATGFRMLRLKEFPIADMLPAMVLVMPLSWIWTECLVPLLG